MAAPMRSSSVQEAGHRPRVADSSFGRATGSQQAAKADAASQAATAHTAPPAPGNFEYDDNEWDIGIGDLIIDLDADIEKTTEKTTTETSSTTSMAANAAGQQATKAAAAKMAVEHSATVDKGLKMKIKRTKPGTKTSEAKHEIVKSNELQQQNGIVPDPSELKGSAGGTGNVGGNPAGNVQAKHNASSFNNSSNSNSNSNSSNNQNPNISNNSSSNNGSNSSNLKRGSSGHRRDKTRDKHNASNDKQSNNLNAKVSGGNGGANAPSSNSTGGGLSAELNGGSGGLSGSSGGLSGNSVVRVGAPQTGQPRSVFPASTGPGPPSGSSSSSGSSGTSPNPPPSPAAATAQGSAAKPEQAKVSASNSNSSSSIGVNSSTSSSNSGFEDLSRCSSSPPPSKKIKTDVKVETSDVCVGTSVGTITEPDCLGPCEPGTSVTLEGIVWHETESGVLVVNVTWRGKTYVGTLLDCTRHDWAPPRFCDSPTSDLDNRTPKGRETRSSVHSKLRNGGVKGRRGAANGSNSSTGPSSPTPFVPPRSEPSNKRKNRTEDEPAQTPTKNDSKKTKVIVPQPPTLNTASSTTPIATTTTIIAACSNSPPPSPVLLECPEPNCSKKYKHINGLKYHQSHAHGSINDNDEESKDLTSMSENDESNIEAPSPVKSPEVKSQDSPATPTPNVKRDEEVAYIFKARLLDVPVSRPSTPNSTSPTPIPMVPPESNTNSNSNSNSNSNTNAIGEGKNNIVKPGVLRFPSSTGSTSSSGSTGSTASNAVVSNNISSVAEDFPVFKSVSTPQVVQIESQQFQQRPSSPKITNFKVKPTAALMPDEKLKNAQNVGLKTQQTVTTSSSYKKKNRKSSSPNPPNTDQQTSSSSVYEQQPNSGREDVQSPAYSDISDDGAPPILESDPLSDKGKVAKKVEPSQGISQHLPQYGMYPFYGQPQPYLVEKKDGNEKQQTDKNNEKETITNVIVKKETAINSNPNEFQSAKSVQNQPQQPPVPPPPQHYYPYGYMGAYPYQIEPNYMVDEKIKEERIKESPSPIIESQSSTQVKPIPNPIQVPTPKSKQISQVEPKDKSHQNDNHQILKESIEMKNQMHPYNLYRNPNQHSRDQRDEEMRRFYAYEQQQQAQQVQVQQQQQRKREDSHKNSGKPPSQSPNLKQKHDVEKDKKEIKQEGVKPTMETQGPPPPPTSQYAYIHHNYMPHAPHYGTLNFDPNHSMYRGLMVPGPYGANPYLLNAQIPRYHAPEDLSRAQPQPTKALDMLEHHAQYYSQHKIHELQERAIKSPTPKTTSASSSSPSTNNGGTNSSSGANSGGGGNNGSNQSQGMNSSSPMSGENRGNGAATGERGGGGGKQTPGGGKDSSSPPLQRHVHTHHHTHVGLNYPMYPAHYGAAVIASQQAAAVTVINPYPTK